MKNLAGREIALTRRFASLSRERLAEILRRRGAEIVDRVSHRTAYLLMGGAEERITGKMRAWRAARGGAAGPGYIPEAEIGARILGPDEVELARLPARRKRRPLEMHGRRTVRRQGGSGEIRIQSGEVYYGKIRTSAQASRANKINRWLYENAGHSPGLAPVWMSNWSHHG